MDREKEEEERDHLLQQDRGEDHLLQQEKQLKEKKR
jgi:hypothetical protein